MLLRVVGIGVREKDGEVGMLAWDRGGRETCGVFIRREGEMLIVKCLWFFGCRR